ncbi:unnamed protein product [Toxocara canis]|uniref:Secreted protein n=1 Tax=Toxocara canis TaxID=6265 RepID=A0A183UB65_TOXCA|nr:unnamed protein product [Toxocara canis]
MGKMDSCTEHRTQKLLLQIAAMSIRYLPMALTRRKTKLLLLVVLAVGLTIYCLAESQGISRRMPHYTQRPAPIANSTHSRTAQLENAAANKEDYAKSFITANSNDNYGNQKWHLVSAYEVEDVTTKCGQRYPQEARTDFNVHQQVKSTLEGKH